MLKIIDFMLYGRLIRLADIARDGGRWEASADIYSRALEIRPGKSDIWVQLGNVTKEASQFTRARKAYAKALQIAPNKADTHLQLGHLLKVTGDAAAARRSYLRAQELDPTNDDVEAELKTAIGNNERSASLRKARVPTRRFSLNASIVSARQEIEHLLRFHDQISASDRDRTALASARSALTQAVSALDGVLAQAGPFGRSVGEAYSDHTSKENQTAEIVFDVSDLIQYFRHHRLPTGIQRVQIEVISVAIMRSNRNELVRVCCFTESTDFWREVSPAKFLELCDLASVENDWTSPDWQDAMQALESSMDTSPDFQFSSGSFLINIGTSWWLQNYFLHVREAKRRKGIKYIPFVHDLIPVITPEYCVEGLVQDFIGWIQGVCHHADFYLVNSESTRRDLRRVTAALGYDVDDRFVHTVTLDADYRKPDREDGNQDVLATHRLEAGRFVLFVSTIEARKNHLAVFDAWLTLMKQHGTEGMPHLVCVGSRGWLNDATMAKLGSSQMLQDKVLMLSGVPDIELAELYQKSLFSVYPSFYEGWGLPVTESLSYGKTAVVSRNSSLMEAGGNFVEYFTPGDQPELLASLSRLLFDSSYREARETKIRQEFKARSWEAVAADLLGAAHAWRSADAIISKLDSPVDVGRYYSLSRNVQTSVFSGMGSGEIFRVGDRWWGPDNRGCWLKSGPGQLRVTVEASGRYELYLGLRALPTKDVPFDVTVLGSPIRRGKVKAGQTRWLTLMLKADQPQKTFQIIIEGYAVEHLKPRADQQPQPVALGVIGLMICRDDDEPTRSRFMAAIALDEVDELARGDRPAAVFPINETH